MRLHFVIMWCMALPMAFSEPDRRKMSRVRPHRIRIGDRRGADLRPGSRNSRHCWSATNDRSTCSGRLSMWPAYLSRYDSLGTASKGHWAYSPDAHAHVQPGATPGRRVCRTPTFRQKFAGQVSCKPNLQTLSRLSEVMAGEWTRKGPVRFPGLRASSNRPMCS